MSRRILVLLVGLVALCGGPAVGGAHAAQQGPAASVLSDVSVRYRQAVIAHDPALAARLRAETKLIATAYPTAASQRLAHTLTATVDDFHPWPLASTVDAQVAAVTVDRTRLPSKPYDQISTTLAHVKDASDPKVAATEALAAFALSSGLRSDAQSLDDALAKVLAAVDKGAGVSAAVKSARSELDVTRQVNGDVHVSRAQVVSDAAILVFREGLEAVLILAAITASFTGARKHMRRPVLIGGVAGIGATIVTWLLVQLLIDQLGTGGLRLEAVTGILAIAVLLVVTNWFFHKVYWSQWISRFNKRRKSLEKMDKIGLGFLSGQGVALGILGLTSVYREGFETVLFLQNLQVSAGTSACVLGAGIGMAGTLGVGVATFLLQQKLPYKKMLIATGVLIAVVLAVMTGTTVHVMQGLGWMPTSPTSFTAPIWANSWLGFYATWETIIGQFLALAIVLGSYFLAREVQVRGPQRRRRRAAASAPQTTA